MLVDLSGVEQLALPRQLEKIPLKSFHLNLVLVDKT